MTTATHRAELAPLALLTPPRVRAALARKVIGTVLDRVPVTVELPDGTRLGDVAGHDGERVASIQLVRPDAFFARVGRHPKIGIGESYMAGDWQPGPGTDLADVMIPFADRMTTAVPKPLLALRRMVDSAVPAVQRNTPAGSRRNIEAHYDLSNDLFAAFLDETLTYSSALFDHTRPLAAQSLEEAQLRKVHAILDGAGVGAGTRVLEIGTGWGTLAIEAARRGADVTTLTLSREQADLARGRVAAAGFDDRVDIRLEDYREATGEYDAIVSVEMIEAVGEEFWPSYFASLDRLLAPNGRIVIQSILMSHDRYLATRNSFGWIQKHIFPGGLIPSLQAIDEVVRDHTGLRRQAVHAFGTDYAETLHRWRQQFTEAWPRVEALGFDDTFRRKWEFYLAYCEAGFSTGYLDVAQISLARRS
ncbi:cyclopropane-fatty-acyl-phospholipid synthase [Knoellia sinensis KCTC 19936]|uniref:Cyclopropane-fatty-acyl-phospholipid synthase n=1 Tax=Knoellia sinensis KCTC 19936 TaxID=1385520 RepID=A0A0A0J2I1_9MICO|nr:cyclopropane-fatty-acyl-phospholipid synthase family protein [Knoellia sinensis]KGN31343.1 cyclopropane-fatty-acyl-phospholipid synthase [Knoellia sinensis KCTC 19936]